MTIRLESLSNRLVLFSPVAPLKIVSAKAISTQPNANATKLVTVSDDLSVIAA
jgi:hypothetical protein